MNEKIITTTGTVPVTGTGEMNYKPCYATLTWHNAMLKIDRKQYEDDLQRRQKEHLDNVYNNQNRNWRPCLHDSCPECLGSGVKRDGSMCVHYISCPCPKCSPSY